MPRRPGRAAPPLAVELRLDPELARACAPHRAPGNRLDGVLAAAVTEVLREFGIPGDPAVSVTPATPGPARRAPLLGMAVAGRSCRYPDALPSWVQQYIVGGPPDVGPSSDRIRTWLLESAAAEDPANHDRLLDFLAVCSAAILRRRPALLLGDEQLAAYLTALPSPPRSARSTWPPTAQWLRPILTSVLDLGISLADTRTVAGTLAAIHGLKPAEAAEELAAALAPATIELRLPRSYLRELTTAYSDRDDLFRQSRRELRDEFGMSYPPLRFVADNGLARRGTVVRVNHRLEIPVIGPRIDQCLVNETATRLAPVLTELGADVAPVPARNPANDLPCSIVPLELQPRLESMGYTTWNPIEFVVLYLTQVLRQRSGALVTNGAVQAWLEQLARPRLVQAARTHFSIAQLTRVLRGLVVEQVSIGDLARILERLLDFDGGTTAHANFLAWDDDLTAELQRDRDRPGDDAKTLLAFVRSGLRRQISAKEARGGTTVAVYLLDQEIEQALASRSASQNGGPEGSLVPDRDYERLVEAIGHEVHSLPPAARKPAFLTDVAARSALGELLSDAFPGYTAVAYPELMPDLDVQPVARISLSNVVA